MTSRILTISLLLSLMACNNVAIKEVVKEAYPNNQAKLVEYVQGVGKKEKVVAQKSYYENGQFKMGGELEEGQREGLWTAYFEDGKLQSEGEFKHGIREGLTKVYYPNAQLMYEGQFSNDEKVGNWKFYNEQGKLVKEENF